MPVSCWNLKYIFLLEINYIYNDIVHIHMQKAKTYQRDKIFRHTVTGGPFQELFNRTRCTTCNRFYFLSSVVTFDAFHISNQKQKCTNALKFDVHSFLQNSNNKDLQKFAMTNILNTFTCPDKWKKLWLKATQMIVNVLCLSARYMEFSKFIEKHGA